MTQPLHEQTPDWSAARQLLSDGGLLSVILPVYNLAGPIAENIRQIAQTFRAAIPFELIAVNDGSADRTSESLRQAAVETPELRILQLEHNQGKGAALRTGFNLSRGSHILFLDADLDLPPAQTARFFDIMHTTRADAVIGSKRHPDAEVSYPPHRRIMSEIYYQFAHLLLKLPVRDTQVGIKLFHRPVLEQAMPHMKTDRFAFDVELLCLAASRGFHITEAPVRLDYQFTWHGIGLPSILQMLLDTLRIFHRLRIKKSSPAQEI